MLSRLGLLVTHNCNLKCSYCYAKGGNYGLNAGTMNGNMAIDIFNHFQETFEGVQKVFFFGGEPLLALNTIKSVCYHIKTEKENGNINEMPTFSIVTNGTLLSEEFVQLSKNFNFSITVSLDGPQELHDINRHTIDKQGSFNRVMNGINLLKSYNRPFSIECTYTKKHWDKGYSPIKVFNYLKSLGADQVVLQEELVMPPDVNEFRKPEIFNDYFGKQIDLFHNAIIDYNENGTIKNASLANVYKQLLRQSNNLKDRFCEAGSSYFAVNPIGDTYPCHMLNNQTKYNLGKYKNIRNTYDILPGKNDIPACIECSIKNYCLSCPAAMYLKSKSGAMEPDPVACHISRAIFCIACASLMNK